MAHFNQETIMAIFADHHDTIKDLGKKAINEGNLLLHLANNLEEYSQKAWGLVDLIGPELIPEGETPHFLGKYGHTSSFAYENGRTYIKLALTLFPDEETFWKYSPWMVDQSCEVNGDKVDVSGTLKVADGDVLLVLYLWTSLGNEGFRTLQTLGKLEWNDPTPSSDPGYFTVNCPLN
jgi:hypothetical protein